MQLTLSLSLQQTGYMVTAGGALEETLFALNVGEVSAPIGLSVNVDGIEFLITTPEENAAV